jgi:hypothetical protein
VVGAVVEDMMMPAVRQCLYPRAMAGRGDRVVVERGWELGMQEANKPEKKLGIMRCKSWFRSTDD